MPADGLVSSSIGSLINGVSQQPAEIRLSSQNEEQINFLSDIVRGVVRRPPFQHVAILEDSASVTTGEMFYHFRDFSDDDRFILAAADDEVWLWDLTGSGAPGHTASGLSQTTPAYTNITGGEKARDVFRAIDISEDGGGGDQTILINKQATVGKDSSLAGVRDTEFIVEFVALTGYAGQTQTLTIDGHSSIANPVSNDPTTARNTAQTQWSGDATFAAAGWTFTNLGPTAGSAPAIRVNNTSGAVGDASYTDSLGGTLARIIQESVQTFADLPASPNDGAIYEITGDDARDFDSYYVQYDALNGVWDEVVNPEDKILFTSATEPRSIRLNGGVYNVGNFSLSSRQAGDEVTNPDPPFAEASIEGLTFFEGRLGFITGEELVLSEATKPRNFWFTTAIVLIDSDPITVAAGANRVTPIDWAIPFNRGLTLFSSGGSYEGELSGGSLFGDARLTPETARVIPRGQFACSEKASPIAVDDAIFIPVNRANFTGFFEYRVQQNVADIDENTAHVQRYIPKDVFHVAVDTGNQMLVALTEINRDRIYVYRYFNQGANRLMSSWSFFEMDPADKVQFAFFHDNVLYVVIERSDGLHLEKMDLAETATGILDYTVHLDSQVQILGSYNAGMDETTWTLPYNQLLMDETKMAAVASGSGWAADKLGEVIPNLVVTTGGTIMAPGDWTDGTVSIGRRYTSTLELSRIFIKERTDVTVRPTTTGRLQLRKGRVFLTNTGFIEVVVTNTEEDDSYTYPFTGVAVGQTDVDEQPFVSAFHGFDIGGENRNARITLQSDSHLPAIVTGLEWEGFWFRRGDRV